MLFLAQSGSSGEVLNLAQYGVLGAVIIALLWGRLVVGRQFDKEVQEKKEAQEELRALRDQIQGEIVPALVRSTDTLARATEVIALYVEKQTTTRTRKPG